MSLLKVENVRSGYGKLEVLHGVSLEVKEHEIVSVIGLNGAGKSTLLNTISGVLRTREGEVTYDGCRIVGLKPHQLVKLGLVHVPEGRRVFGPLTVYENLALCSRIKRGKTSKMEREIQLKYVYDLFPILRERQRQLANSLSGGEQQMLAMGRGLMLQPKLLLLDELSLGLAPLVVGEIFSVIQSLNRDGIASLLVEQNTKLALSMSDRAYLLELGNITLQGSYQDFQSNDEIKKRYLGQE